MNKIFLSLLVVGTTLLVSTEAHGEVWQKMKAPMSACKDKKTGETVMVETWLVGSGISYIDRDGIRRSTAPSQCAVAGYDDLPVTAGSLN